MNNEQMARIEPQSLRFEDFLSDLSRGRIQIPQFQRDFVWSIEQTADLIDSIIKGFPIGTFIFWKTMDPLGCVREIGNGELPYAPQGELISYALDGQQRILSLYLVHEGLEVEKSDYKKIFIDLERDIKPDDADPVVTLSCGSNGNSISIYDLLHSPFSILSQNYAPDVIDKIEKYKSRLQGYVFPIVAISDFRIDMACEIFTRINTGGTELTLFDIMIAKTYDEQQEFNLRQEYDLLIDSNETSEDLKGRSFETIGPTIILRCIAAFSSKGVGRQNILQLNKSKFIENWESVKKGVFAAVDYFRTALAIPVARLLPYEHLLILFSYFFVKNGNPPDSDQNKWLKQYFWWAALSRRFGHTTNSRVEEDLERMEDILANRQPSYQGEKVSLSLEDLKDVVFTTGDAFCKSILCLYADFTPRSFTSNSRVTLDNSWLLQRNSKNYHHFFPKGYLKNAGVPDWFANNILNITFVDDYLNKRIIGAKPPSEYMAEFREQNPEIDDTMRTHLIDDLDAYGIEDNDYETFINSRGERVLEELDKRLGEVGNVRREAPE